MTERQTAAKPNYHPAFKKFYYQMSGVRLPRGSLAHQNDSLRDVARKRVTGANELSADNNLFACLGRGPSSDMETSEYDTKTPFEMSKTTSSALLSLN
jgi:hypothetical protein